MRDRVQAFVVGALLFGVAAGTVLIGLHAAAPAGAQTTCETDYERPTTGASPSGPRDDRIESTFASGAFPRDVAVSAGGEVFVTNVGTGLITLAARTDDDRWGVSALYSSGVAHSVDIDDESNRVFATLYDACQVFVYQIEPDGRHTTAGVVDVGASPLGIAVDPETGFVFVANSVDGTISVVDGRADPPEVVGNSIDIGERPTAVSVDPETGRVFVANRGSGGNDGSLVMLDGRGGDVAEIEVIAGLPTGAPSSLAVDPESGRVFVVDEDECVVTAFDGRATGLTVDDMSDPLGAGCVALALDADTDQLYVAQFEDGIVSILDSETLSVLPDEEIVGFTTPAGLTVDPASGQLFVTEPDANQVSLVEFDPIARSTEAAPEPETSTLLGLPTPGEALTAKNSGLAFLITLLLLVVVAFPSALFNDTLKEHLDDVLRWLPARLRRERSGANTEGGKPNWWSTPRGFALYLAFAALIYSRLQPDWGLNRGTVVSFFGFYITTLVVTGIGIVITRRYVRATYDDPGRLRVELLTLAIAVVCVVFSRLADFVPGYFFGVVAVYGATRVALNARDNGRINALSSAAMIVVAVGAWIGIAIVDPGPDAGVVSEMLGAIMGGFFLGGVETLAIGLTPVKPLPGAVLREYSPRLWAALYAGALFLFALVLLRPGLADAQERSFVWTLIIAGVFGTISILFWAYFRFRHDRPGVVVIPEETTATPEATTADRDS